ncbi:MAG: ferredoxin-type protein NapH [Sphingobacteriales bacterium]|jgi:ferredoxin-type protein NapH
MSKHTTLSKFSKNAGMTVFLASFVLLLATLFMGNFTLEQSSVDSVFGEKATYISPLLEPIIGKTYTNKASFVSDINQAIDTHNETVRANKEWDKEIYSTSEKVLYVAKASLVGKVKNNAKTLGWLTFISGIFASLIHVLATIKDAPPGIKNNGIFFKSLTYRGWIGMSLGSLLISFYVVLYWFPAYLTEWIYLLDPLAVKMSGSAASQWFLYGCFYTIAVVVMGIRFIIKYRHNKYQKLRTLSVMFFQVAFAFAIPQVLQSLSLPAIDLKNIWPLDYSFFFEYRLNDLMAQGTIGFFMLGWGLALIGIGVPVFVYFFGKRWYCSWVCGCGGLAETAGDSFRHLSDNGIKAWKIERYLIHGVLVFAVVMTGAVLYTYFTQNSTIAGLNSYDVRKWYGFGIGSVFAGVIGTGFYPLMGNRMWCRFGCPLAAYLGLVQRFKSKFRITTNGGQCISCGNCSTHCEMGIDVKWYAQRGEPIIRSSCVGCGICSAVCPRGVLNLESADEDGRFNGYIRPEEIDLVQHLEKV